MSSAGCNFSPHHPTTPTWSTQFPPQAVNFDFASVFVGVVLVVSLLFLSSNFQHSLPIDKKIQASKNKNELVNNLETARKPSKVGMWGKL